MIYSLRRGSTTPTVENLNLYELGWETTNKRLYVRDNGNIVRLNTKVTLNGVVNNDPSLYAPQYIMSNKVLKTKASWTLGQDPFEYISIDGTVTVDSTNLITSGAVSSAITTLQSVINEALNNKADIDHTHEIDDTQGLQAELNSKLPTSLDIPIAELNNHTLREVFETNNILNGKLVQNQSGQRLKQLPYLDTNGLYRIQGDGIYATWWFGYTVINSISNNYYYFKAPNIIKDYTPNNNLGYEMGFAGQYISNNSGSIKWQNTINNNTSFLVRGYYDTLGQNPSFWVENQNYLINMSLIGISSLTVTQMDYWFNVYQTLKDIESIKDKVNTSKIYIQSENPGEPASTDSVWFHI